MRRSSGPPAARALTRGDLDGLGDQIRQWVAGGWPSISEVELEHRSSILIQSLVKQIDTELPPLLVGDERCGAICAWSVSPWDSEVLQVRVGRCAEAVAWGGSPVDGRVRCLEGVLHGILDQARAHGVNVLFIRTNVRDPASCHALQVQGFRVYDAIATFRTVLSQTAIPGSEPEGARSGIEHATGADLPALQRIARSFRNTHFHADPRIPRGAADELYARWITNSVDGRADATLVARDADTAEVLGFVTCGLDLQLPGRPGQYQGTIGLIATDSLVRGRGVGKLLIGGSFAWFREHHALEVAVGTQIANDPAVSLYQRSGFKLSRFEYTLHAWL